MQKTHVLCGADRLEEAAGFLSGLRVGLMTNPTGVNRELRSTIDLLAERTNLTALFAVEHGIRGDHQAGEKIDELFTDPETGIPVYSAYGKNARFTPDMLAAFDALVFDMQDAGARFYTYLYSLSYAMEACARAGKAVVVLDRPNPLGGLAASGTILDRRFASFVGDYELPTQYGLTIGEYALYVRDYLGLDDMELKVIPLAGWRRELRYDETDLPWVAPSPNLPTPETAICYPGTCVFEGTNISEGRGTCQPFQLIGAPWLHPGELERRMGALSTPGIRFRRASFRPTFGKFVGELCHGVQMHVTDRDAADVFAGGLLLLEEIRRMSGDRFEFLTYDGGKTFFLDKLLGTDSYRTGRFSAAEMIDFYRPQVEAFRKRVRKYFLYE